MVWSLRYLCADCHHDCGFADHAVPPGIFTEVGTSDFDSDDSWLLDLGADFRRGLEYFRFRIGWRARYCNLPLAQFIDWLAGNWIGAVVGLYYLCSLYKSQYYWFPESFGQGGCG